MLKHSQPKRSSDKHEVLNSPYLLNFKKRPSSSQTPMQAGETIINFFLTCMASLCVNAVIIYMSYIHRWTLFVQEYVQYFQQEEMEQCHLLNFWTWCLPSVQRYTASIIPITRAYWAAGSSISPWLSQLHLFIGSPFSESLATKVTSRFPDIW